MEPFPHRLLTTLIAATVFAALTGALTRSLDAALYGFVISIVGFGLIMLGLRRPVRPATEDAQVGLGSLRSRLSGWRLAKLLFVLAVFVWVMYDLATR